MQHSPTTAVLSTSFLVNHASQKPQAKRIDYKIQGVIQQREVWVVSQKRLKKSIKQQLVEFWQCANTARENAIFVFPVLPGNAEAQVIWAGILKRRLIPYFIGRICAKNILKICFTCAKSYSKTKVGRFLRHGVV